MMKLIIDDSIRAYQARFPRSKRRRIRKKWNRRATNYEHKAAIPDGEVVQVGGTIIANSRTAAAIRSMETPIGDDLSRAGALWPEGMR